MYNTSTADIREHTYISFVMLSEHTYWHPKPPHKEIIDS
jgi:hypothetical protein